VRPTWDQYFLEMAKLASTRAVCSRRQVGAVLVDVSHVVLNPAYNGVKAGALHCGIEGGCPRGFLTYDEVPPDTDYNLVPCNALHAEHWAVLRAGIDKCKDSTMYITCAPCHQCDVLMGAVGVSRAVWPEGEKVYGV